MQKLPEEETGYQLDPNYSFWSVVVPEDTQNLCFNPSFESNFIAPGSAGSGFAITNVTASARSHDKATGGVWSLKVTPTGIAAATVLYNYKETGAGPYTFAADIYHTRNEVFTLQIQDASHNVLAGNTFTAVYTGWGRYSVSYTDLAADATGQSRYAGVIGKLTNSAIWYSDRWQIEAKAYPTTYVDGDMRDEGFDADPYAYGWQGFPHQSASYRSALTFSGGKVVSLWDFIKFRTTAVVGLGLQPPTAIQTTLADGTDLLTGFTTPARNFSVVGKIYAADAVNLDARVQALIDLFNVAGRRGGQVLLRYQPVNSRGAVIGFPLTISCLYQGGLDGNFTNFHQIAVEMKFKASDSALVEDFGTHEAINYDRYLTDNLNSVRDATGIIVRDPNTGAWSELPGSGATAGQVLCACFMKDGSLLVGGTFTSIAGVTASKIARYDFNTKTWAQLGFGGVNNTVRVIVQGRGVSNNAVFVGGDFTFTGLGVTLRRAAYLDVNNLGVFHEMSTGLNNPISAMYCTAAGLVYVSGTFTADNASHALHGFASYDVVGDTWADLSSATTGKANTILEGPDGRIFWGGDFTVVNAIACHNFITLNPVTHSWSDADYAPTAIGLNGIVNKLTWGPDGYLYAAGSFTANSALTIIFRAFARWIGDRWEGVGNDFVTIITGMAWDKRGQAFMTGDAHPAGEYDSQKTTVIFSFNGSEWLPFGVVAAGSAAEVVVGDGGKLAICLGAATAVHFANSTVIDYQGTAAVKPNFKLYGTTAGGDITVYYLANWTTKSFIYFKSVNLVQNDELTIDFTGDRPLVRTVYQGDITEKVMLSISDLADFRLVPGRNHISCLIETGAPSVLIPFLYWKTRHISITVASRNG